MLFEAHHANHIGLRTNEAQPAGFAHFGEIGVLAQKAVAGMDGVGIRDFSRADHARNIQIAARAFCRPDADRFIGKAHVQTIAVGLGVNRNRADAQLPRGAYHAQRDLSAIGDKNFVEHAIRWRGWRTALHHTPRDCRFRPASRLSRHRNPIRFRSSASSIR